eukprot:TRINITY_DN7105_c0_g2_i1.p1 TRINITY_DN7105_c0_g2~~TRINITY_DN7105_c0_g2_i1.p1  ORF type:complete len:138 (-),score=39.73 TRINITY_DN7105_c0_g2_i1:148-561(-)
MSYFGFIKKTKPLKFKNNFKLFQNYRTPNYKTSTGIAGLPVSHYPREEAIQVYTEILEKLKGIPEDANYRINIEHIAKQRIRLCQNYEDVRRIEFELGELQIEEMIEEGRDELILIPKMIEWKPWEFDGEVIIEIGD